MRCIQLHSCNSLFSPLLSVTKHNNQQPCITILPTFNNNNRITSTNEFLSYKQNSGSLKTKAISTSTSSIVIGIGITSSAKPVDIKVLAITSAVFLFVYWIANFVVPDILIKDMQSGKTGQDNKFDDDE